MGNDIQKGTTYAEGGVGGAGTVNAANLNAHVDEARIKSSFISSKSLKDPASLGDAFVVENSGVLYRETMQQVLDLINVTVQGMLPVGVVIDFAGENAPDGWLLCYGQAVSRDVFEELFLRIGVLYGSGNGVDTFNVPDLRGFVVAGKDNMGGTEANRLTDPYIAPNGDTLGAKGGAQTIVMAASEMPYHQHTTTDHLHYVPGHQHPITTVWPSFTGSGRGAGTSFSINQETRYTDAGGGALWSGAADRALTTDFRGGNVAHNNVQPTMVLNKIIRAQS